MPATASVQTSSPLPRRRRRRWPVGATVLLVALAGFAAGLAHLFDLRFTAGEVFPVYSTLRSDPLGTKALYYSLQALPGLRVERNERPLRYLGEEPSAVLQHRDDDPDPTRGSGAAAVCYIGANAYEWPFLTHEAETIRLEKIMERGGRVIIAFIPITVQMTGKRLENNRRLQRADKDKDKEKEDEEEKAKDDKAKNDKAAKPGKGDDGRKQPAASPVPATPAPKKDHPGLEKGTPAPAPTRAKVHDPVATPTPPLTAAEKLVMLTDLVDRWHLDFLRTEEKQSDGKAGTAPLPPALDETAVPVPGAPAGLQPVTWHGTVDFDLGTPGAKEAGWGALYTRSQRPVIVARPFGTSGGELILISDPYFFSNEALRKEPRPALLAALVGPCRRIIFDETHLGIAEQPGLMTLSKRYHLQGALAALVALAILFLWKNMVSLVPPPSPTEETPADNAAGAGGAPAPAGAGGNYVTGRDSAEGFVNLLRRGVPARDLLKLCVAQWQAANTLPGTRTPGAGVVSRLDAIAAEEASRPIHRRSSVAAYRAMCAVLKRRGGGPGRPPPG